MYNSIAWIVTILIILALGTTAIMKIQDYNENCYAKINGITYLLCYE